MMQNISMEREYCVKLCGCSRNVETKATSMVSAINVAAGLKKNPRITKIPPANSDNAAMRPQIFGMKLIPTLAIACP